MLGLLGRSLNVISLAGLAFAVGMLVDNAVVVLENIYRRWDNGEPPLEASVRGTVEVWGAVLSSTLTTVAVFLPIVFVQEEAGQLFRDIALAISAAVVLSLVASMTFIPMAARRLLRERKRSILHTREGPRTNSASEPETIQAATSPLAYSEPASSEPDPKYLHPNASIGERLARLRALRQAGEALRVGGTVRSAESSASMTGFSKDCCVDWH